MSEIHSSVCPHDCPSTCALDVEVLDGQKIGAVRGADNPYTGGVICNKVARYAERVHHPERVLYPLLRTGEKGSGTFRRIGWDEALDRVVAGFGAATEHHGSEAAWAYSSGGTMGLVQRDGIFRLRHALRWSGRKGTICSTIAGAGWTAGCGRISGSDSREMAVADLNVLWGTNPVSTQVNVMAHVTRARKERGAKLVVIDPYRTGTAAAADLHLAPRPGTDAALACAVMHCAFRDGHADRAYMADYADDAEALEAHLATRGPAWAAEITGLSVAEIEAFAALYNTTPRAYIRCGYGFTRGRGGAAAMHAVTCLPTVTGKWHYEGGGALFTNKGIFAWDKSLIEGTALRDPAIRELDMSRIASVLTGDADALHGGPGVHALLVQSGNPASVCPDSNRVRQGLMREDLFTVVHEQFLTETARYADVVLPATMFLEHDDIYQAMGHSHIQIGRAVIDPPGEAIFNHDLVCALARCFGLDHPTFAMTALELADATLRASGYPPAADLAERRWLDVQLPFRSAHFLDGFAHPDGRFRFRADWRALGDTEGRLSPLPDWLPLIDGATDDRPLRLVTAPARQFLNSTFTETPNARKREGRPQVLISPEDGLRFGVGDGALARLGNARGEVVLHARHVPGQRLGTIVVESIWPAGAFGGPGHGINVLTSDEAALPSGGAVFHDTSVWIRAEAEAVTTVAA
ncbi:Anaerobic selenocysteine-containing dehydrogenase [Methylobacterium sp. UNC378MF]|uniref:molybdopterin-containing oxidoreductase family protein n=1 Tax=Methylobacterium sp. UNC378MF TaxID=1502748 RepID=UPI00088005F1|nr:molybdopterin-dependent oxidoreductase [Methylobacterium sp. UNC378MF]SDA28044.1 Anaerobic selenocysteine-containing dehydrogenase [Methylobacterium sp. UNC378MF]